MTGDIRVDARVSRAERAAALQSLTRVERTCCTRLIERQFKYNSKVEHELEKYGPEGVGKLFAARAIGMFMLPVAALTVLLGLVGASGLAAAAFAVILLMVILVVGRCVSGAAAGRR